MKSKKNIILSYLISIMPTSRLRVFLYRNIFGYHINNSILGWNTVILVSQANLNGCCIGRKNKFTGPIDITIKKGAIIGERNIFQCGWWTLEEKFKKAGYDRNLIIGVDSLITSNHYFDIVGSFILGDASWIAGYGSQFWTHGVGAIERNISIGKYCYIGSAVRFAPGVSIGNNTLISLGSVLTNRYNEENVLIGGQPAKILTRNYKWKSEDNLENDDTGSV